MEQIFWFRLVDKKIFSEPHGRWRNVKTHGTGFIAVDFFDGKSTNRTLYDWLMSRRYDALSKNQPMRMRGWLFFDGIDSKDFL